MKTIQFPRHIVLIACLAGATLVAGTVASALVDSDSSVAVSVAKKGTGTSSKHPGAKSLDYSIVASQAVVGLDTSPQESGDYSVLTYGVAITLDEPAAVSDWQTLDK